MIKLTPAAVEAIKKAQGAEPALRIGVQGGGCSGFQYHMEWENEKRPNDKVFEFDDLKVIIDSISMLYLDGCEVDYVETLMESGFKFNNPNVKTTCGCGQSFGI